MIVIGLTGSIGMGKSTTAKMFAARGIPVTDSDQTVHRLYAGRAAGPIEAAFPGTAIEGVVDREKLAALVLDDPPALRWLEAIVHPLVREEQAAFVENACASGAAFVLIDIPLLFESGGEARVDTVVVVTCAPEIQRARVLSRDGMTEDKFEAILRRQVPDSEKRRRADFVIDTGLGLEAAERQVDEVIAVLSKPASA